MITYAEMVDSFMTEVLRFPFPDKPQTLTGDSKKWALDALREEIQELEEAERIDDQADALIDVIYFSIGRLLEMGLDPDPLFTLVHSANMKKITGKQSKPRGNSPALGCDAIKPPGWQAPMLLTEIRFQAGVAERELWDPVACQLINSVDAHEARRVSFDETSKPVARPKIIVIGHGRHGKDTVCEILRDEYGFSFQSSSMFCAEKVCLPYFNDQDHLPSYDSVEKCFNDRHGNSPVFHDRTGTIIGKNEHRKIWFDAITAYNTPDKSRLGYEMLSEFDIYCGLRNKAELHALIASGIVDYVIWVDRSDHVEPESKDSCSVEPWMADFVIDNNGDMDELKTNVSRLVNHLQNLETMK